MLEFACEGRSIPLKRLGGFLVRRMWQDFAFQIGHRGEDAAIDRLVSQVRSRRD
jgi:hypothetical protein